MIESARIGPQFSWEDVPFSHHAEVAVLRDKPKEQERILARVADEDLTVGQTRELVRQDQQGAAEAEFGEPEVIKTNERCEHCGAPEWAWERRPNG